MREVISLWVTRKSESSPELLEAWDDFSIDGYPEGWMAACQRALDAVGEDLDQFRYIVLKMEEDVFSKAFFTTFSAEVEARSSNQMGGPLE